MVAIPGVPAPLLWAGFLLLIGILLWLDLAVFNRKQHAISVKEALLWTAFWVALSLAFNAWVYFQFGKTAALEFFTGYLIEKSLSVDNLFVFLLIFTAFSIPREHQHKVLFWGILGAIITRGLFIGVGSAFIGHVAWAFAIFGLILLWAAYRMLVDVEERFDATRSRTVKLVRRIIPVAREQHGGRFVVRENGRSAITVLLVALVTIELTDILFAFDSIPAIFAVTSDPFIVFTSNIFAILGLRSLYFALSGLHHLFRYLKHGLAAILIFIACKMLLRPWYEVPVVFSLVVIVTILVISILASVFLHRRRVRKDAAKADATKKARAERVTIAK
jgi:tellurite resistance protein TerC